VSDMSMEHCGRCRQPAYACMCKNGPRDDPREERIRKEAKKRGCAPGGEWLVLAGLRNLYPRGTSLAEINAWVKKVCSQPW
jgi:hypothetical protein